MLKTKIRGQVSNFNFFCILCAVVLLPVFLSGFFQNPSGYSLKEAVKVMSLIEKIQQEQLVKGSREVRNVVVTESELNSYIAHRIETEKEEILKELQCKLFDKNKVEWKIVVDLKEANLPKILKPRMTFFMGGELEVKEGNVRLDMKDLFLENQRIQVSVFDLVIFIGSRLMSSEPFSMSDWWELPYGIKDIQTQQGKATFYY
jgi:hypothetical protein